MATVGLSQAGERLLTRFSIGDLWVDPVYSMLLVAVSADWKHVVLHVVGVQMEYLVEIGEHKLTEWNDLRMCCMSRRYCPDTVAICRGWAR